jgi:hypothetical protein
MPVEIHAQRADTKHLLSSIFIVSCMCHKI